MTGIGNIATVARREYLVRVRTRAFAIGTALLVAGVALIAYLPVIFTQLDRIDATKLAVGGTDSALVSAIAREISPILNAPNPAQAASAPAQPDFVVTAVDDVDTGRRGVQAGTYTALLAVGRSPSGELSYTLYTNDPATSRTAGLVRAAANALTVADRLQRLGVDVSHQATLFAPAEFAVEWPDPARTDSTQDTAGAVSRDMLAFGMTILIFMILIMYGNWIAMSVVEEKSSRVMEVVLNAATPFQLLTGKVLGVGAVAFTQYAAVVVAGGVALMLQGSVASAVLGSGATLQQGLTPALLVAFGLFGVLGFLLYAALFAGAGSLVSRQEDVNAAVMPLTLLSSAGYMIGVYAAMGLLDIRSTWVTVLTLVPFLSPFMMLGRVAVGAASPVEIVVAVALLVAMIGVALWVAARLYAVGVLLYGSRPGPRTVLRLLRTGM